ncbi:MAG TPA: glutamate synthase large subunit, partial [Gammaproteobacteria bacterium]
MLAKAEQEAVGSMGDDTPMPVLSQQIRSPFDYFRQQFAQVTNPPIDSLRERNVMSLQTNIGRETSLFDIGPQHANHVIMNSPVLSQRKLRQLLGHSMFADSHAFIDLNLPKDLPLPDALDRICAQADQAVADDKLILLLSDRYLKPDLIPVHALLATGAVHHHLVAKGQRCAVNIIVETGVARDPHHFACLIGYGATAVYPYLAYQCLQNLARKGSVDARQQLDRSYRRGIRKGLFKIMSKMGISSVSSYRGAQLFEIVGLHDEVVDRCFRGTVSRIQGANFADLHEDQERLATYAWEPRQTVRQGGLLKYVHGGEYHCFNPDVIATLQAAVRSGDFDRYRDYARLVNDRPAATLRDLFGLRPAGPPVPLDEVEPIADILPRFESAGMSLGALSPEAHEALAIAMNRIGGRSNSGEGGEDPARYDSERRSKIKQVASGRFGVTAEYLVNAEVLQIKIAQGAKPGEGGQLPGHKVNEMIARLRYAKPGVGLISPPPHHDIYSIEDLAELIHDLKNANREARISVKLVSEVGVGTIAAGVSKAHADVVLISGYDGGTGASPLSSIKHAGIPWELGLAETHQTLVLNNLRSRIVVETDGQLKTGRDVVIATLLGAEEFGFATAPLVVLGCILMRVCHLNTCPVGVATQDPRLRAKFTGSADHVVNFMRFIAQEVRELMAQLGFRTLNEMVGRSDRLEVNQAIAHWKARGLDFSNILHQPAVGPEIGRYCQIAQDHGLARSLDVTQLLDLCRPAIDRGEPVRARLPIRNINRVVGTILGYELTKRYGPAGLPDDTIQLKFDGSAGQSFGAFVPHGITLTLEGDANDYVGKGLSGGKLIIYPPKGSTFAAEENIIVGNVAFYGATQ